MKVQNVLKSILVLAVICHPSTSPVRSYTPSMVVNESQKKDTSVIFAPHGGLHSQVVPAPYGTICLMDINGTRYWGSI